MSVQTLLPWPVRVRACVYVLVCVFVCVCGWYGFYRAFNYYGFVGKSLDIHLTAFVCGVHAYSHRVTYAHSQCLDFRVEETLLNNSVNSQSKQTFRALSVNARMA